VGVSYWPSAKDKSAIYVETMPLFSQGLVELLDVPQLETELRLLERKPRAGGRGDSVDHPPRGNDDVANAACGALWLASIGPTPNMDSSPSVTHSLTDYDVLDPDRGRRNEITDRRPPHLKPTIYV
jgi:hypothetical protein